MENMRALLVAVVALAFCCTDAAAGFLRNYPVKMNGKCIQTFSVKTTQQFVCKKPVSCQFFNECRPCGGLRQIACPVKGFSVCAPTLKYSSGHCFCPAKTVYSFMKKECVACGVEGARCCTNLAMDPKVKQPECAMGTTCIEGTCQGPKSPPPPATIASPPPPTY